ncbi:GDSL esterase/lipase At5g03610-like isoform X2 [Wolffia australiana]
MHAQNPTCRWALGQKATGRSSGVVLKMEMEMERLLLCFWFVFCVLLGRSDGREMGVERHGGEDGGRERDVAPKLFVFGDSYADTGNIAKMFSPAWKPPYGVTFPKKPSGRFSDGRVLPDYVASFLGIPSPVPYKYRKQGKKLFPYGMNFAVGGTGVFDTGNFQRNLSVQIDNFHDHLAVLASPLRRSTALVSVNGNDYLYLKNNGGGWEELRAYIPKVIAQLKVDLGRIHGLGVAKVGVTNLHPIGCTPLLASLALYRACNETANGAVVYHNGLLAEAVAELNADAVGGAAEPFVLVDLFSAFNSSLTREMNRSAEALKPCCEGTGGGFRCGSTDENGAPEYRVCDDPGSKFYWDMVHPTQAAWSAVVANLGASLRRLLP